MPSPYNTPPPQEPKLGGGVPYGGVLFGLGSRKGVLVIFRTRKVVFFQAVLEKSGLPKFFAVQKFFFDFPTPIFRPGQGGHFKGGGAWYFCHLGYLGHKSGAFTSRAPFRHSGMCRSPEKRVASGQEVHDAPFSTLTTRHVPWPSITFILNTGERDT